MDEKTVALADGFDAADLAAWRALVDKALDGKDFDRTLVRRTVDGLARGPLMTRADADADKTGAIPRRAPADLLPQGVALAWDIRQAVRHPDPAKANEQTLADLEGGGASIELVIDPTGADGVIIGGLDDLETALKGVHLDLAGVSLDAGAHEAEAAALLVAQWSKRGHAPNAVTGAFNMDPFGRLATRTRLERDLDVVLADAAGWAFWVAAAYPRVTTFRADARPVHEAGGSEAQEIGWTAAVGFAYLKLMVEYDLPVDAAADQIAVAIAVDADVHLTIAKLRALRRVWARMTAACGASARVQAAKVQAFGSRRMLAKRDPWTNMLRLTAAGFGAVAGGADAVTLPAFTDAIGPATPFARRIARNTQLLLAEESHIGAVADPAAGSFHHEAMTDALARKAWAFFQQIEAGGGLERFIVDGVLADAVANVAAGRRAAYAKRAEALVGVSEYPALEDLRAADVDAIDLDAVRAGAAKRAARRPKGDGAVHRTAPDMLVPLAEKGCDLAALAPRLATLAEPYYETPLKPLRWAAPFEALRDAADAAPARPTAFLATIGALKAFSPRAAWTTNLLAAGGVATVGGEPRDDVEATVAAWKASKSPLAVICGADAGYAATAVLLARALVSAGATVWLAGRAGALEQELIDAGVARFIFMGQDALDALRAAHAALGVASLGTRT